MSNLPEIVRSALASEYRMRGAELHKWVDPLTDEQFWTNPYSYGNSVGHLVLHLTGNLNYYIGARVASVIFRTRPPAAAMHHHDGRDGSAVGGPGNIGQQPGSIGDSVNHVFLRRDAGRLLSPHHAAEK